MGALTRLRRLHTRRYAAAAALAIALLPACGSGDDLAAGQISVSDAWALSTVAAQPNGAVYFTITSSSADNLEGVTVPKTIADHAEMHDEVNTASGMQMQEMSSVRLDPGTAVTFTPGGKHVMLVELAQPLAVGERFDITLEFDRADAVTLPVEVLESAP